MLNDPIVPLGDPIDFTEDQLEAISQLSNHDIQKAIIFWHQNSERELINLIDAMPRKKKKVKE